MQIAVIPPNAVIRAFAASSSSGTQSHSTLPCGVCTSSARCPLPTAGSTPTPYSPGSSWRTTVEWLRARSAIVVHCWPSQPTYCLSSVQIGHWSGGWAVSAYCTAQVWQIQFATVTSPIQIPIFGASDGRRAGDERQHCLLAHLLFA